MELALTTNIFWNVFPVPERRSSLTIRTRWWETVRCDPLILFQKLSLLSTIAEFSKALKPISYTKRKAMILSVFYLDHLRDFQEINYPILWGGHLARP
ncbi:hypothetical protein [Nostoc sp.]|uniref:hypothetical protein n=1 Tax=Nostoc sp. TaxID=1180 RepID=UPI002FF5AA0F